MINTHELKIDPLYFRAILQGHKNFEIRFNDRLFKQNDIVILHEYKTKENKYTGKALKARIGYISSYAQKENYIVFSLLDISKY